MIVSLITSEVQTLVYGEAGVGQPSSATGEGVYLSHGKAWVG